MDFALTARPPESMLRIVISEENDFAFMTKSEAGLACSPLVLITTVCLDTICNLSFTAIESVRQQTRFSFQGNSAHFRRHPGGAPL
jgi:hypothetical protein